MPSLLKENPLLCHEADAALKKNHVSYVLQINTNIKFHNKIYLIQHSARPGKRCIEVTNRDEYKNITTRNVCFVFFLLSIMDIAAYTMTLQTNCRDQNFVSIVTFRDLQSVSVMDARKWRNPSWL